MSPSFCYILTGALLLFSSHTFAQLNETIRAAHLSSAYASIINFSYEPDISSSHLWIDDNSADSARMTVTKFPLRHEFKLKKHAWKPVVQATLARLKLDQTVDLDPDNSIDSEWESYSATLGGGVRIPLSKDWSILPAFDAGYAHLKNEADYYGLLSNTLKPELEGKLFDWTADAWIVSGHLNLYYTHLYGKLTIDAHAGGTLGHIQSYDTTHALQEFSETIGTVHLKLDGTYPLGLSIAGDPLSVVGHLGNNTIVTEQHSDLISSIYETGLSLQADITRHGLPVKKVGLGAKFLWGNEVIGWSIITSFRF